MKADTSTSLQILSQIVDQIRHADYDGNRMMLQKYFNDLEQFTNDSLLASKAFYWRGFAMWRIAVNGFNDSADSKELDEALKKGIKEFDLAALREFANTEAKIGAGACRGLLAYLHRENGPLVRELVKSSRELLHEVESVSPDNPRLLWVLGPIYWNTPVERGGGPDKSIELYNRGLQSLKSEAGALDALAPTWGEPELLMSLAWSYLNHNSPDINSAERYALAALKIVPYWHYVKDILLPQIKEAKERVG